MNIGIPVSSLPQPFMQDTPTQTPSVRAQSVQGHVAGGRHERFLDQERALAIRGRERVMHMLSAGRKNTEQARAQQRVQTYARITVLEDLPKNVKLRFIGYHGSTRGNVDSMAKEGVDFNRTGKNFQGRSTFGAGLYVTPEQGYATIFAYNAQNTSFGRDDKTRAEVTQVFVDEEPGNLAEMRLPPGTSPLAVEPYREAMREAHLVHLDPTQSIVTERGAQSEDVNFYVLRNQ